MRTRASKTQGGEDVDSLKSPAPNLIKVIELFPSLETLNHHNQIHNDIKPQNYLVKLLGCQNNLSSIEIVLTDFGLAGSDSKGGTPIFASPECLANSDRKDKSTDIFSLGRVFLFMILPKEKFLQFLFVALSKGGKDKIMKSIQKEPILNLISKMMGLKKRCGLLKIRKYLQSIAQLKKESTITEISHAVEKSMSVYTNQYIDVLKHFS